MKTGKKIIGTLILPLITLLAVWGICSARGIALF